MLWVWVCVCGGGVENAVGRQLTVKMEMFAKKVVIYKLAWGQVTSLFSLLFPLGQHSHPPSIPCLLRSMSYFCPFNLSSLF